MAPGCATGLCAQLALHADAEGLADPEPENTLPQNAFGPGVFGMRKWSDCRLRHVHTTAKQHIKWLQPCRHPRGRSGALRAPGQVVKAPRVGTTFDETATARTRRRPTPELLINCSPEPLPHPPFKIYFVM